MEFQIDSATSPAEEATRLRGFLDANIEVNVSENFVGGPAFHTVECMSAQEAEKAAGFIRTALLDEAIEFTGKALDKDPLLKGVAVELRKHQSERFRAKKAATAAVVARKAAPAPAPKPSKRVEFIRDAEGKVLGAKVWES
jgi:hypothetical protein